MAMTSANFARHLYLIVLIFLNVAISVEAFYIYPIRRGSVKSQLSAKNVKAEFGRPIDSKGLHLRLHSGDERHFFTSASHQIGANGTGGKSESTNGDNEQWSRKQFLRNCKACLTYGFVVSTATAWSSFPDAGNAKSYSENAANLERINNGDFSGGSVFNNNPTTERGKKRRAMTGCKVAMSREEASTVILQRSKILSEKECNTMVMDGETEFMLQALRNLDCPTCANGIGKPN